MIINDLEREHTLDSLEVIGLIHELESLGSARTVNEDKEFQELLTFAQEAETINSDWTDGTILINDRHFEDYIREQVEDVYSEIDFESFPFNCIDWSYVAEQAMYDYDEIELGTSTFWIAN
jgi:hypothetical protein